MIRLLADQNFNGHILHGLLQRDPTLPVVRVQDVGLSSAPDSHLLAYAAAENRVLLTHDRQTIPGFAYARVTAGQLMPGVFLVGDDMPTGQAIDEILLAVHCLSEDECRNVVRYFPM